MKQKVSKRILSMLLAVVMIIGFVPTFNLTVLAEAVEADTLAGKTVITKVELTIEDPKLHNKIRGYDAGWQVAECIANDSSKPYYYDNFYLQNSLVVTMTNHQHLLQIQELQVYYYMQTLPLQVLFQQPPLHNHFQ